MMPGKKRKEKCVCLCMDQCYIFHLARALVAALEIFHVEAMFGLCPTYQAYL